MGLVAPAGVPEDWTGQPFPRGTAWIGSHTSSGASLGPVLTYEEHKDLTDPAAAEKNPEKEA
jgi:hypothetical protein